MSTAFLFTLVLAGSTLLVGIPVPAAAQADEKKEATYVVGFHELPEEARSHGDYKGGKVKKHHERLMYALVDTKDASKFEKDAKDDPNVRFAFERMTGYRTGHTPTDPDFPFDQYGAGRVRAPEAWDTTVGSPAATLCVVDTGVRYTHQDLAGPRYFGGIDIVNGDNDPWDDHGHGTHVTGIAAATINNGMGIAGITQAGFYAVKVLDASGFGSSDWIADGIDWCTSVGADVINISIWYSTVGSYDPLVAAAIQAADAAGTLVVGIAGNGACSNCVSFPGNLNEVIASSCTTSTGAVCSDTSQGAEVDLSAPGDQVFSTCASTDVHYCSMSGTSMSAPHIAGVAALILSYANTLTADEVRAILEDSAEDLGASGFDNGYGHGEVDAKAALDLAITRAHHETYDDGTANGWTVNGMWHVTTRRSNTPTRSLWYGQEATGNYDNGGVNSGTATTPAVTVPNTSPKLSFKSWWQTEGGNTYDQKHVEISNNGGSSWSPLLQINEASQTMEQWNTQHLSLASYAGQSVLLRFRFDSFDGLANNMEGWYIDDVQVTGTAAAAGNAAPDACFSVSPTSGTTSTTFQVNAGCSTDDGGAAALQVRWDWENDGVWDTSYSTTKTASKQYSTVGTKTIKVEARDAGSLLDTATQTVTVSSGGTGPITVRDDDNEQDTFIDFDHSGDDTVIKRLVLPSNALTGATSATLYIRGKSLDCGLIGNNHRLTSNGVTVSDHNPCSIWSQSVFEWKTFSVPLSSLTAGTTNSFEVFETAGSWLDRNVHFAIDSDTDVGRSDIVANGANINGELMWYLVIEGSGAPNAAPDACFTVSPTSGTTSTVFNVDAACSTDDAGTSALQVRWDWENDGVWDTSYSTTKTASKQYSTAGTKTIKLEALDAGGLTDTATQSVTVSGGSLTVRDDDNEQDTFFDFDHSGDDTAIKRLVLPSNALSGATSATLHIRGKSLECGLPGNNHRLTSNGVTVQEYNPCSIWSQSVFEWKTFSVPLSSLTAGTTNSFEVYEIAGDWIDRNIHFAIDSDNDFGRSDIVANGAHVNGELMWYLVIEGSGAPNAAPDACFSVSPTSGTKSTVFAVDAACSTDDGGTSALQVRWDWENDGFWDTSYTTTKTASTQYSTSGTKTIKLEVKDGGGLTDTATQTVTVTNGSPTACFSLSPSSGPTSTVFSVNAGCSSDDGGTSALQVRWDWENDGVWDTSYSTTKTATKQYSTSGTKTIKLEVRDVELVTATTTQSLLVNNPPTACFSVSPTTGTTATVFGVNAGCSSDDMTALASLEVRWDWENDGAWDTSYTTTKTASKQYSTSGTKTIKVEVRDGNGATSTTTRTVTVNAPPSACFTASPTQGMLTTTFQFNAACSSDDLTPSSSLQVRWDFENDGTWDTGYTTVKTASKQYSSLGQKTIRLEVLDGHGATSQTTRTVTVYLACTGTTCA